MIIKFMVIKEIKLRVIMWLVSDGFNIKWINVIVKLSKSFR